MNCKCFRLSARAYLYYVVLMEGNRERSRPRRRWMDEVKGWLSDRGLTIPEAKQCVKDRREWRRIVGDVDDLG